MTEGQQFEVFLHNHHNMVFSTAMRLLAKQSDAEDVTQDVFLCAFQRFAELRESPTAGGWLRTVATNLSLNHLTRYRSRWSFFSDVFSRTDDSGEEYSVEPASETTVGGDEQLAATERRELVERALQSLVPAQRVPLVLHHFEGLSYEEIAVRLGVSLAKVKTDIFRGREVLRRKLRLQLEQELG
jgi:RNA polymerase sigma-70 factor (ECF subfamily)